MIRTRIGLMLLTISAAILMCAPASANDICNAPVNDRASMIAASAGPFNTTTMAAVDHVMRDYISGKAEYADWKEPAALPTFYVSDCYAWQRTVALARYPSQYEPGGSIAFVKELLNDTSIGALRVAVHERIHQWQPRWTTSAEKAEMEAKVQYLERILVGQVKTQLASL